MQSSFQTKKIRLMILLGVTLLVFLTREAFSQVMNSHMPGGSVHQNTPQKSPTSQIQDTPQTAQQWNTISITVNARPTVMPTATPRPTALPTKAPPTAPSTPIPTQAPQPTAIPTAPSSPPPSTGAGLRYFPVGTSVSAMQAGASAMTKQQVKVLIEQEVDNSWGVIQSVLALSTKEKAYAFFLGMASVESTLRANLETGSGPSHSYGPIQTAEPAYANANPTYTPEHDVPEMVQYTFTPQNYYDPGIAVYMGIRHLIHFTRQAQASGYTGIQIIRHGLIGYNTGDVNWSNQNWIVQYSDEIGALAGWYLLNGHLYDTAFTYTGDPQVNRSQPWGWY